MNKSQQEYKTRWINHLSEGTDTTELQVEALRFFLYDLGYQFKGTHIVTDNITNPKFISLQLAVGMFNGSVLIRLIADKVHIMQHDHLYFDKSDWVAACKGKILKAVHLQRIKRGSIKPSSNWVQFNKSNEVVD